MESGAELAVFRLGEQEMAMEHAPSMGWINFTVLLQTRNVETPSENFINSVNAVCIYCWEWPWLY